VHMDDSSFPRGPPGTTEQIIEAPEVWMSFQPMANKTTEHWD